MGTGTGAGAGAGAGAGVSRDGGEGGRSRGKGKDAVSNGGSVSLFTGSSGWPRGRNITESGMSARTSSAPSSVAAASAPSASEVEALLLEKRSL